ncbi:MAG: hypothetical protein JWQ21_875 [Herminiimonas sp.]|nr:hypothetical protein [Herminiimonas sp.]
MTIRTDLPWPLKVAFIGIVLGLGGAVAMWTYDMGRSFTGFNPGAKEQLATFKEQIDKLSAERDQFSSTVDSAESQLNIERSAQKQLAAQVKALEVENTRLKEDLAFFESLLPADTGSHGIAIRRLKVEIIDPNQLRYRLLIMQGGKGERDFVGNIQFAVTVVQGGKSAMMIFPEAASGDLGKFKLGFKHYQRVEGVLTLPDGALVKAVQARVLEKGQIRAQQSANL